MTDRDLLAEICENWEVTIVGAGPAGGMAAFELACAGIQVLLVDRAQYPRHKVCGCCLNGSGLKLLQSVQLKRSFAELGAQPLHEFQLTVSAETVRLPLSRGHAISRKRFDSWLVSQAIKRGATFLPGTHARWLDNTAQGCRLTLRQPSNRRVICSRVVLCADGLGGDFLKNHASLTPKVQPGARIGLSTILPASASALAPGLVTMAVGNEGYVGSVRLENGEVNVAAALDSQALARHGSATVAIRRVFEESAAQPVPSLTSAVWRGTPPLTRRRPVLGAERLFVLGDSAAYVEPFTGEGMAWALSSGLKVSPVAKAALDRWDPGLIARWERIFNRSIRARQWLCRLAATILKHQTMYRRLPRVTRLNRSWTNLILAKMNSFE